MYSILIIDDEETVRENLNLLLTSKGYRVLTAVNGEDGLKLVRRHNPDLLITDLKMPVVNGFQVLDSVMKSDRKIPVIVLSAFDDMHSIIKAMELGAYDYVEKPFSNDNLLNVIDRAIETKCLSNELIDSISDNLTNKYDEKVFVGKSKNVKEIFKKVGQVCSNRITVLIHGDSGTGKELLSRIIHSAGVTKGKPFVAVNCTALTETLLESELFGHVKGSFTGAIRDKKGKFELAGDGTIFLDEISEISPELQIKLLRSLEEKEFEPVGGEKTIPIRARIITATNKNLQKLVEKGKFRKDLFYRLNVFSIYIPPLSERKEDIPLLVVEFLNRINAELHKEVRKVPYEVIEMLQNYTWHGNVRELYNTLLQAVVLSKGDVLEKENILLKEELVNQQQQTYKPSDLSLDEVEKIHISNLLQKYKGNKLQVCKILGITKPTLNSKIKKYSVKYIL
ncbi:MAG: sigma-54-dependent Fis family transcriptional regulator [Ignavibacteriales bacterium]|nr:MAG: sigma-54-dependent Fis family transcriptional regulator [Ignavibacteriales bacterium]